MHIQIVHEKNKPFNCEICEFRFSKESKLKSHVDTVHKGKKPFHCHQCDYSCTTKSRFNSHISKVHDGIVQAFQCEYCDKKIATIHILNIHGEKKDHKCQFCEKVLSSKYA